ncbi:MAG: STAS domain-containing protein [Xanthomonadaceae bacterium]|nr:STAS domain-containing protein [Xanthomonadaceae bacterium]
MSVSHEYDRERDCLTIRLEESFDFAVHKAFREAYAQLDAQPRTYVIDTSGTERIDSSALGMLMLLCERARSHQAAIHVVNCSPALRNILRVSGFDKQMTVN